MKGHKKHTRPAADKRFRSRRRRNGEAAPRTAEEYFAKPKRFQDIWTRITHVISKMRADGASLYQASRDFGLDPRTVVRLGGSALRKRANGRYAAKASDRLLRVLLVLTPQGKREIALRDSRQASEVAEHWNAVHQYLETGDASAVQRFRGKHITDASGTQVPLLTDLDELDLLGFAGVLSFESLYARSG